MTEQSKKHFSDRMPFRRGVRYAFETMLAYVIFGFFWILPLDMASGLGGWLLRSIGPKMATSRKALKNIRRAFPEKTPAEHDDILKGMWDNLGRVIAEYPHLYHIWERVELVGGEHLENLRDDDAPGMVIGGHLANWEIMPLSAGKKDLKISLVYRKPNNPWVDSLLLYTRKIGGDNHIPKNSAGARKMLSTLRKGGHLGVLVDQKLNEGIAVPFFGRDAMTAPAVAVFGLKFKCPIHPARVERIGGANFRLTILPAMELPDTEDKDADVLAIMTEVNALLEGWIRERPEQWLWLHRRWSD